MGRAAREDFIWIFNCSLNFLLSSQHLWVTREDMPLPSYLGAGYMSPERVYCSKVFRFQQFSFLIRQQH